MTKKLLPPHLAEGAVHGICVECGASHDRRNSYFCSSACALAGYACPEPTTGCWLWTASEYPSGYGMLRDDVARRSSFAHRISHACPVNSQ